MRKRFTPRPGAPAGDALPVPLGGTRAEAMRRVQMGVVGVIGVLLLVGLASIIKDRAVQTESVSVSAAAATSAPQPAPAGNDPLAEAGMVPEIPASPTGRGSQPAAPSPPPADAVNGDGR